MTPSRRESAISWNIFTDIIRHIPTRIERLLRHKVLFGPLSYRDRLYIAAFCFQNGVSPYILETMIYLNNNATRVKVNKMCKLYEYWEDPEHGRERRERYWAYDLVIGRICDLNGKVVSRERHEMGRNRRQD